MNLGAFYILGITLFAGFIASLVFAPALGTGLALGVASFCFFGSTVSAGCSMGLLRYFDFTNYKNPKNVVSVFSNIKNTDEPLPLDYFERLNRYGIISDSELKAREAMEERAKEYPEVKNELESSKRKQRRLQSEIKTLKNLQSKVGEKDKKEEELNTLNQKIDDLEKTIQDIREEFTDFHLSIVDFDPS